MADGRSCREFNPKLLFALVWVTLLVAAGMVIATPRPAEAIPSFARQTGQPCGACHTDFPALTPFGRRFKHGEIALISLRNLSELDWLEHLVGLLFIRMAGQTDVPNGAVSNI